MKFENLDLPLILTQPNRIDLIHKSHNAPVPYPTMHHSEQKCAHFCSEWCMVGYGTGVLWHLWLVYLGRGLLLLKLCSFICSIEITVIIFFIIIHHLQQDTIKLAEKFGLVQMWIYPQTPRMMAAIALPLFLTCHLVNHATGPCTKKVQVRMTHFMGWRPSEHQWFEGKKGSGPGTGCSDISLMCLFDFDFFFTLILRLKSALELLSFDKSSHL